jgi:hypothetical protein
MARARLRDRCKLLRESDFEMMTACATRFEFVCLAEISFALVYSGTQKWEETVASRPLVPLARFAIRLKRRRKAVGGVGIVIQRPTPVVILNTASGTGFIN